MPTLRKSTLFFLLVALNLLVLAALSLHAEVRSGQLPAQRAASRALVRQLKLSDLCLFTEARYTRHPAMADRHAPFQDHPLALEHFPSGSLVSPPALRREAK
ncbi:hypothetical protein GMST_38470 [Geomonas silvestris]|uniref:Uncharacterized protein n=1 Tax=Geomonas silvestris TaxID=2740184 RepID=A0A6V8MNN3_9BACT|nr:hypothetical protein [Geomonas silvestris]GFO61522.1 hypothetical protein GMST_38470 [Geomonas silvestris]